MFHTWEHWVWIKPVKRQFVTDLELGTGNILCQEVAGVQERLESLFGANQEEYQAAVENAAASGFLDDFSHEADPVFGHGMECFRVNIRGSRKVKPARGTAFSLPSAVDVDGSYTYDPAVGRVE